MINMNSIDGVEVEAGELYCLIGKFNVVTASDEQLDMWASQNLTDEQFELEYQLFYLEDKRRYIHSILNTKNDK